MVAASTKPTAVTGVTVWTGTGVNRARESHHAYVRDKSKRLPAVKPSYRSQARVRTLLQ